MKSSTQFLTSPCQRMRGEIRVPGDKSISHRAIMLAALAEGKTEITGFLQGQDSLNTLRAFKAMGVSVEASGADTLTVTGVGLQGLRAPGIDLDLGNSGTSMRLLAGVLAGQTFSVLLKGDPSLSRRPMQRVTVPLAQMGARISTADGGLPPLSIQGGAILRGIEYRLPIASAQVKSCLLLAGLYAEGETAVIEPAPTRDHTERMLRGFGYPLQIDHRRVSLIGGGRLSGGRVNVPADISSAAFFIVAATLAADADIVLRHVGVNPTRTGMISILKLMGADISLHNEVEINGEPVADIHVRSACLRGVVIPEEWVPLAIDEFPVLFIAAACAQGDTVLTGAEELRVKESDRIQAMVTGLQSLGIEAEARPDGAVIRGGQLLAGEVDAYADHRIAMAFAVAGIRAEGPVLIRDCANVATSFPNFVSLAQQVGMGLEVNE